MMHSEPANALSFPTWMVHVSSLIEWLAAMTYVWRWVTQTAFLEAKAEDVPCSHCVGHTP